MSDENGAAVIDLDEKDFAQDSKPSAQANGMTADIARQLLANEEVQKDRACEVELTAVLNKYQRRLVGVCQIVGGQAPTIIVQLARVG